MMVILRSSGKELNKWQMFRMSEETLNQIFQFPDQTMSSLDLAIWFGVKHRIVIQACHKLISGVPLAFPWRMSENHTMAKYGRVECIFMDRKTVEEVQNYILE